MNSFNRNGNSNSNPNQNAGGIPGDMHNFYFTHNPHANYNFYVNSAPPPPNPTPTYPAPNIFQQSGFPNNQLMGLNSSWMPMPSSMNAPSGAFQMNPLNQGGPGCFRHARPHPYSHHHHQHHHSHGHRCSGAASDGSSTSDTDTASTSSGCHSPNSSRFGDQRPIFAFQQGTFHPHAGCLHHQFRPIQPQPTFGIPSGSHGAAHRCQCANGNQVGNPSSSTTAPAAEGLGGMGIRLGPASLPGSASTASTFSAYSSLPGSPGSTAQGAPTDIIEEPLSQNVSQN